MSLDPGMTTDLFLTGMSVHLRVALHFFQRSDL